MSDMVNQGDFKVDDALLEKVNPVFQTARMTLFQLAANGDADAAELAQAMGLTRKATQDSTNTTASPEQVLGGTIMLESRYRTMARLAKDSGFTLVDLPCGYTPRGLAFARRGLPYYGLDLPVVIREISEKASAMLTPEQCGLVHYREVDATNYASLEKALEDVEGEVCITTEGLLMYFTNSEAAALCDNVRRILEQKGGCWYVADPESPSSTSSPCARWWESASPRSCATPRSRRRTSRTWKLARTPCSRPQPTWRAVRSVRWRFSRSTAFVLSA